LAGVENPLPPILTPIQVKILLAMLRSQDHCLDSETVIKETGIALSTWSAEQGRLGEMGLIDKHLVRILKSDSISKRMNYTLTETGVTVGLNLLNISRLLSGNDKAAAGTSKVESFEERILECVEVGLDSFGVIMLLKTTLENEYGLHWQEISEKPEQFMSACRDLFGEEASEKLETLISANIATRFALQLSNSSIERAITKARQSFSMINNELPQDAKKENPTKLA
jgi:hypothetical protein